MSLRCAFDFPDSGLLRVGMEVGLAVGLAAVHEEVVDLLEGEIGGLGVEVVYDLPPSLVSFYGMDPDPRVHINIMHIRYA